MPKKGYKRVTDPETGAVRFLPPTHPLVQKLLQQEAEDPAHRVTRWRRERKQHAVSQRKKAAQQGGKLAIPDNVCERVYELALKHGSWHDIAGCLGISIGTLRRWREDEPGIEVARNRARARRFAPVDDALFKRATSLDDPQGVVAAKHLHHRHYPEEREQQQPAHTQINIAVLPTPDRTLELATVPDPRARLERGSDPKQVESPFASLIRKQQEPANSDD